MFKEYYRDGILAFEGNYLHGKRNGFGKEFSYDGKLKFEGEFFNGHRNGYGKEYHWISGDLIYKGNYLKGEKFY